MAPAQIIGFVRYESRGIPTPHLVNNLGLDSDEIEGGNIEDNTMYVGFHASFKWLSLDTLEKEFQHYLYWLMWATVSTLLM